MNLYVANSSMQTLDIVDYSKSIIWHTLFCGAGDFEIAVPANAHTLSIMTQNNIVYRDDSDIGMIIEKVNLVTDEENGDQLIVSGRSCESIIGRRIIWGQQNFTGSACAIARGIISRNIISPTDQFAAYRRIDRIIFGDCATSGESIVKQLTGDNVLQAIVDILGAYGLGFKLAIDLTRTTGNFSFSTLKGIDRSRDNADNNPYVIFSHEFDNLISSNYSIDYTNYRNTANVGGEGEGNARTYAQVNPTNSGLDRFELFVDERSISSNEGAISPADYAAQLMENGIEKLGEASVTETFSGEIEPSTTWKFGEDYFLGDIVTIENQYGMSANVRITGVTENFDENGYNFVLSYENI